MRRGLILGLVVALALPGCKETLPEGLPHFEDPAPGTAAPSNELLGLRVGESLRADVDTLIAKRKLDCRDLSPSTLGDKMRAQRAREKEAAKPNATTRASPSKAGNPQVRLSCPNVAGPQIQDRERGPAKGRWLFVFDSPEHALRHTSFRRRHRDHAAAAADLRASVEALTLAYGPPTSGSEMPTEFKRFHPYKWEWTFATVRVEASALNYGKRGVDVLETVEVPWPVRVDAAKRATR